MNPIVLQMPGIFRSRRVDVTGAGAKFAPRYTSVGDFETSTAVMIGALAALGFLLLSSQSRRGRGIIVL